jgi:phosphatidylserine/phosphatidylglycerophosphate/cardiolipin synthase-like enzyme
LDKKENFELFCLSGNLNKTATYHPKLYLFNHPKNEMTAIVGSSNLTRGGLENNVEINIAIRANYTEPIFTDLLDDFQQLEIADRRVRPNSTYIDYYEELYQLARKGKNIALHPKLKAFKTLESELPSPKLNANELVGWMKLVYDHLPTGQLPASEIYQYEKYFKNKYPENQFIQAKIRQQLQFLEKMGLLEKISRNNWKKV